MKNRYYWMFIPALAGCGSNAQQAAPPSADTITFGHLDASVSLDANATALASDYDAGGIAMYKALALATDTSSNMVFSAYAVQTVMGMMYAGAGGNTATNLAQGMRWSLSTTDLPPAHETLTTVIATNANQDGIVLQTGTRIWVDKQLGLKSNYAANLAQSYGAQPVVEPLLDSPEQSRVTINQWISDETQGLIPELIPQNGLNSTVLVQTAALYFKAAWAATFTRDAGATTAFTHADNTQSQVTMVRAIDTFPYVDANGYRAIDVAYGQGSMGLLIVMPTAALSDFEASLNGNFVHQVLATLQSTDVALAMPVLNLQQTPDMTAALKSMGVVDAFSGSADFDGIGTESVQLSEIYEQAVLRLDENGTEAAAAAAAVAVASSAMLNPPTPIAFTVDHPFFFAIHDTRSGTSLFTGRVAAPNE